MDCNVLRGQLDRLGRAELPAEAGRHLEVCPRCRAHLLLRMGSAVDPDASPAPGFEARLRARIEAHGRPASEPRWTEAVGLAARPVIGVALAGLVLTASFYMFAQWSAAGDLGSLAEDDPVIGSLLADGRTPAAEGAR